MDLNQIPAQLPHGVQFTINGDDDFEFFVEQWQAEFRVAKRHVGMTLQMIAALLNVERGGAPEIVPLVGA